MKIYRKHIIASVLIATLAFGCSDDFLKITNQNELSSDNFYSRVENFDLALNATYDAVKNLDLFGQTFYVQTLLSLAHEADYWNTQCRNEVTSTDGNVYIAWRGWYRVVARANDVINNVPKFLEAPRSDADTKRINEILGEAHFLRGFAYFHLVRLWGEGSYDTDGDKLSVPLILEIPSTRAEMMKPRATVAEVYQQIILDFETAHSLVPESWDSNNVGRISKHAITAFLGQVSLYMGENGKAKTYFEEVFTKGGYALVPFTRYEDLFQGKNEFSEESLWEINYSIDMQQNIWENGLGSGIALVLEPPIQKGWSNCTPHAVNIERFGSDPRLQISTYDPTELVMTMEGTMAPAGKSDFNVTGHSFKKYVPKDYAVNTTNRNSGTNYMIMRLADVYLMYAEVMNNLGNDAVAREYTNKTIRRAYGFDPDVANTDVDLASTTNGIALRDAIREERFKELFAEGHRWYDIVRWKIVEEEVLKYNDPTKRKTQGEIVYQPKDYYYPVPLQEVDNNPAIVPSTGY